MLINNVEMEDLDIYDLEVAEKYEKALELLEKVEDEVDGLNMVESIRTQCNIIFDFFNIIYGEGADKKIFGNSVNLLTCLKAIGEFMEQTNKQGEEIQKLTRKYSPNRAKRR